MRKSGITNGLVNMKVVFLFIGICLMGFVALSQNSKGFEWIRSHGDNNSSQSEWVRDIQVDQAGNIYVAGEVNDQWVRDSTGTIIRSRLFPTRDSIANYGKRDIWLAKYDPQGNLLWQHYAGGGNDDSYSDMQMVDHTARVYPNPTTGTINISTDKKIENIAVYDMQGRISTTLNMTAYEVSTNNKTIVTLSGVETQTIELPEPKGMYLLQFQFKDGTVRSEKVMKQ